MIRIFKAWDALILHPRLADLDDWFLVGLTVVVLFALFVPVARRLAV
jgi:hypothetical protein